jgi:asparagine synthase (glutamine-hydrolysing)
MIIGTRPPFGFERLHYHPRRGTWAGSIMALLKASGESAGEPDAAAIAGYLSGARLNGRTVLHDILAVPPGHALKQTPLGLEVSPAEWPSSHRELGTVLRESLQRALDSGKRVALALSGGLDSALLLALLREMGALPNVRCYTLVTGMPEYCEQEAVLDLARRMQVTVKLVEASERDFVAALARATYAVEEPMYNLHPVAKLLLAEAIAEDGIELAISGDGADQVLRRDESATYLPLCNALFGAASVVLYPPFVDPAVIARLTSIPPDPDKQCLRELAAELDLPERLVRGPKHSRLAPAMDLGRLLDRERIHALAASLDMPAPTLQPDTERVLWTTLTLILDHLGATPRVA